MAASNHEIMFRRGARAEGVQKRRRDPASTTHLGHTARTSCRREEPRMPQQRGALLKCTAAKVGEDIDSELMAIGVLVRVGPAVDPTADLRGTRGLCGRRRVHSGHWKPTAALIAAVGTNGRSHRVPASKVSRPGWR